MPLDRYKLYVEAAVKNELMARRSYVEDTVSAIAGVLSGKGVEEYTKALKLKK